ncbi:MAG: hypothetical protein JNM24_02480 [Bdellovibrionaceae bacterium]|jgi:hypothetical protein|nr:hypothetical protein [Pseudobdellovibrionaceae bacterium]
MKKNFSLTSTKHKPDRQVELVKHEINKYVARERRKARPEGVDYWDFDCKCGATAETATTLHLEEISNRIDAVVAGKSDSVYIEIMAKPGVRKKKSLE